MLLFSSSRSSAFAGRLHGPLAFHLALSAPITFLVCFGFFTSPVPPPIPERTEDERENRNAYGDVLSRVAAVGARDSRDGHGALLSKSEVPERMVRLAA
jgi:hypothetical protein